jgi:hypothetical protein
MRWFVSAGAAALAVLSVAGPARSDAPTTASNVAQLRSNDDYRLRTQAALALGASGDDAAVAPLCAALADDVNVAVKVAAAAALGKLGKVAAIPCLDATSSKDVPASVKSQATKSLAAIRSAVAANGPPPPPGPEAKFYVAIDVTNKTSRKAEEVEALVRGAIQAKLLAAKEYAVAPRGETPAQGGTIVRAKKLKGFYLLAAVEPPVYDGSSLTQVVRVSAWTYPSKALTAEFAQRLTQSDTPSADPASEVALMKMCAENAIAAFQQRIAQM